MFHSIVTGAHMYVRTPAVRRPSRLALAALQPEMCDAPLAPPVVSGGRAFAADSAGVVAYDAKTGTKLWSNRTAFHDVSPSLAVSGNVVVGYAYTCGSVSDPNGVMVAFDATTGAIKWQTKRDSPFAEVVIDSGVVVASGGSASDTDAVSAYRLTDGTVVWDRSDHLLRHPVSAGGTLLLTHTEEDGAAAVSAATGATLWSTPRNLSVLAANPAGDRFYAVQADTTLVALKVSNGAQVWSVPKLPGEVAADGKRLVVTEG
jgi:outer membrane protein assembly factor BamB